MFEAGGFANAVGHEADQTLGELRHFLHEIGKQRGRKSQSVGVRHGSPADGKLLHPGKRQHACNIARLQIKDKGLSIEFAAPLKLAFENHKHCIGGIALAGIDITGLENQFLRLTDEPGELIVG